MLLSRNEVARILGCLFVKRKAGYLSYSDDPKVLHQLLAHKKFFAVSQKKFVKLAYSQIKT